MNTVYARPVAPTQDLRRVVRIEAAEEGVTVSGPAPAQEGEAARSGSAKAPLLYFPDGRRYAVDDTLALDTVLAEARMRRHRKGFALSSRLGWQCLVLLLLVLAAVATLAHRWTVPVATSLLAEGLSPRVVRAASEKALARLDANWLTPSDLDEATQNGLRARFATLQMPAEPAVAWRVVFRGSERGGPLAFSLPDGVIVLTDQLVRASRSPDEVVAVLAHEFGHLQRGDALTSLAARHPLTVLRAWGGGEAAVASLATGLIEIAPQAQDRIAAERFASEVLRLNRIPSQALVLQDSLAKRGRPAALPPLLRGS